MKIEINNGTILLSPDKGWEELVREELGKVETGHNDVGAPVISGSKLNISVSHTKGLTAVMLSENHCGIDVERTDRDFSYATKHYLSAAEQALSASPLYPCAAWCAREALYKRLQGKRGDGLMQKMHLTEANMDKGKIKIELSEKVYDISIIKHNNYLIAYTTNC